MTHLADHARHRAGISRRQMIVRGTAAAMMPFLGPAPFAYAAARSELRFRALWQGSSIGEHRVVFRSDGNRLTVETHIDITARFLFFNIFRLKHNAQEVWQSGRLVSVTSKTDHDGALMEVSGAAVEGGFRIVGEDGPFLAAADLLTSNSLWDSRIVRETRLIDIQHGGEVGLVARLLGEEQVATPRGHLRASRYQIITPYYAGSVFYAADQHWVKALVELKGETLEYELAI
ncbi:MAG: DUF6134 family protein [Kiloniellaceae bacterium]